MIEHDGQEYNDEADLQTVLDEVARVAANHETRAYLTSTDWMAVREAETGTAMPKDVKAARKKARAAVV
jgi:hypothetical protein